MVLRGRNGRRLHLRDRCSKLIRSGALVCAILSVVVRAFKLQTTGSTPLRVFHGTERLPFRSSGGGGVVRTGVSTVVLSGRRKTIWDLQDPDEWEFEYDSQKVERRLQNALKEEDYREASNQRDKLFSMHMDETAAVLSAHTSFYKAFSDQDLTRLAELWLPTRSVMCVNPGEKPAVGHKNVVKSWEVLFSRLMPNLLIKPDLGKVYVSGTTAVVRCQVKVIETARKGSAGSLVEALGKRLCAFDAANIYQKAGGRWMMVHHHVSTKPERVEKFPPSMFGNSKGKKNRRFRVELGGAEGLSELQGMPGMDMDTAKQISEILNSLNGQEGEEVEMIVPDETKSASEIASRIQEAMKDMDYHGKLGGHLKEVLEEQVNKLADSGMTPGQIQREMDSEKMRKAVYERVSRKMKRLDEKVKSKMFNDFGVPEDSWEISAEVKDGHGDESSSISVRVPGSGSIGDNEDDEDGEEVGDEGGSAGDGRSSVVFRGGGGDEGLDSGDLTKKTMKALRMLGETNQLDRRDQRRLITDVIEHAAGDEVSSVEVAFELLMAHHNEDYRDDSSLKEFVDQCKVIAKTLFREDRQRK